MGIHTMAWKLGFLLSFLIFQSESLKVTAQNNPPAIIPAPVYMETQPGELFTTGIDILVELPAREQGLKRMISGFILSEIPEAAVNFIDEQSEGVMRGPGIFFITTPPQKGQDEGYEGYELQIKPEGVFISSPTSAGLFYGFQTLKQIILQTEKENRTAGLNLPCLTIKDHPVFLWRGMLLDCSRHFMEKEFILRYIDLLALYKMNRFHWHLTDDQGWRIQIDKYPELTKVGAWRKGDDGLIYGGFYTKDDIREVVAYAAERHIVVVPEIEMPGHALAALASYPGLSCTGGPFEVPTTWGVFKDIYCAGNDSVFVFLKDVLDEVIELFPSPWIHIGGDESPKYRWENCDRCKSRMEAYRLKDGHALQSWFIGEITKFLASRNRILIGWDEITEGGLHPGVVVQSWQGFEGAIHATEKGCQSIVSPTSHAYFDYPISKTTLEKVYSFNPVPAKLDPALHYMILGGECNIWTERASQEVIDQKVFPRILAMAEVLWTAPEARDFPAFRKRVRSQYPMLTGLGVEYGLEEGGLKIVTEKVAEGLQITMIPEQDNLTIRYTTGSDVWIPYTAPLLVRDSLTLQAAAYIGNNRVSEIYTRRYNLHNGVGLPYHLSLKPGGTYNKNPQTTLTDGIRGTQDFHDGLWLGFWEKNVAVDFNFQEEREIQEIRVGCMQSNPSWIFLPAEIEIVMKPKGLFRKPVIMSAVSSLPKESVYILHDFTFRPDKPVKVKKLEIRIDNPGKCPPWHPGAGSPTWVFLDEIEIDNVDNLQGQRMR